MNDLIPKADLTERHLGMTITVNRLVHATTGELTVGRMTGKLQAITHAPSIDSVFVVVAGVEVQLYSDEIVVVHQ